MPRKCDMGEALPIKLTNMGTTWREDRSVIFTFPDTTGNTSAIPGGKSTVVQGACGSFNIRNGDDITTLSHRTLNF
jgi:hypothetical protein